MVYVGGDFTRILVIEDERRLADTLCELLSYQKYTAQAAYDGESGLDKAMTGIYDAVILDVMMPKKNGFQVVREMRQAGNHTPVLMLTARSQTGDRVEGLDSGADYYLTKPFETEELLAALRAILRRREEPITQEVAFSGLHLDLTDCTLSYEGRSVRLSSKEFEMMQLLLSQGEHIVPKETLLLKVWGYDSQAEDNHVEVYISFLRKKIAHLHCPVTIESARKLGYYLKAGDSL